MFLGKVMRQAKAPGVRQGKVWHLYCYTDDGGWHVAGCGLRMSPMLWEFPASDNLIDDPPGEITCSKCLGAIAKGLVVRCDGPCAANSLPRGPRGSGTGPDWKVCPKCEGKGTMPFASAKDVQA